MDDNPYIKQDGQLIRFDLLKIKHDSQLLCQCERPNFEADLKNRTIQCRKCRAYLDPFDAFGRLAKHVELLEDFEKKEIKKAQFWAKEAETEFTKYCKAKAFREMERAYREGMFPRCPECHEAFDPAKIARWTNKNYL